MSISSKRSSRKSSDVRNSADKQTMKDIEELQIMLENAEITNIDEDEVQDPLALEYIKLLKTRECYIVTNNIYSFYPKMLALEAKILEQEKYLLAPKCRSAIPMNEIKEPYGITLIHDNMKSQIYNAELLYWLSCSFQTAFLAQNNDLTTNIVNVKNVISNLSNLFLNNDIDKGAIGEVWKATVKGLTDLVIIKTYKSGFDDYGIKMDHNYHEYFIGYFLNQLRNKIPKLHVCLCIIYLSSSC